MGLVSLFYFLLQRKNKKMGRILADLRKLKLAHELSKKFERVIENKKRIQEIDEEIKKVDEEIKKLKSD